MKKYICVQELAEYLSISPKTVYHWTNEQRIPHCKISGLVRLDPKKISAEGK